MHKMILTQGDKKMKKLLIFTLIFLLSMGVATAASAAITPSNPTPSEDLTCTVPNGHQPSYYFDWYVDNVKVVDATLRTNRATLSSSNFDAGDYVTCRPHSTFIFAPYPDTVKVIPFQTGALTPPYSPPAVTGAPYFKATMPSRSVGAYEDLDIFVNNYAVDPEGQAITYSYYDLTDKTSNLYRAKICTWNGQFEWTPTCDHLGDHIIRFTITDVEGKSASQDVKVTVTNEGICTAINKPPYMQRVNDYEFCVGQKKSFPVSAGDPENKPVTISIADKPSYATFTSNTFSWSPRASQIGTHNVKFRAYDGNKYSAYEYATLTVKNCEKPNHAPKLSYIADVTVCANKDTVFIPMQATDEDNDMLYYSVSPEPHNADVCLTNGEFTWTPTCDQIGYDIYTFQVRDEHGAIDTESVKITVNDDCGKCTPNTFPRFINIKDKYDICNGDDIELYIKAEDDDNDRLSYGYTQKPIGSYYYYLTSQRFYWKPHSLQYDQTHTGIFTVDDNHGHKLTKEITFNVYDCNPNKDPEFNYMKTYYEICNGDSVGFSVSADDPDYGDTLSYSIYGKPSYATFTSQRFEWTPRSFQYNDDHYVTFKVNDNEGGYDEEVVHIKVKDCPKPNRPPELEKIYDLEVCVDDTAFVLMQGTDPDYGDLLIYSVSPMPWNAEVCDTNGEFTWVPTCEQVGSQIYTFRVTDPDGLYDTETARITVKDCGKCNDAPKLNKIYDIEVCADRDTVFVPMVGTDPNPEDLLIYSVNPMPWNAEICDTNGEFTWAPTCAQISDRTYTFRVTDPHGLYDTEEVRITIKDCGECTPKQNPPTLNVPDMRICALNFGSIMVDQYAFDVEDSVRHMSYDAYNLPDGARFTESNSLFLWQPQCDQIGFHTVDFKVTDTSGASATDSSRIEVWDCGRCTTPNRDPDFKYMKTYYEICNGDDVNFRVSATDSDGDSLSYSLYGKPSYATFTSQVFDWTPMESQYDNDYYLTFKVNDGKGGEDEEEVHIKVKDCTPPNRPPKLTHIGEREVCVEDTLFIPMTASDPDYGDLLVYSVNPFPWNADLCDTNGEFTWTPKCSQVGAEYYTFAVTDGELSDSERVRITVKECGRCNEAPKLTHIGDREVCANKDTLFIPMTASDPNDDLLIFSVNPFPWNADLCDTNGEFTWAPTCNQIGSSYYTFAVTDGELSDSERVRITVKDCGYCNSPPTIDIPDQVMYEGETLILTLDDYSNDVNGDSLDYNQVSGIGNVNIDMYTFNADYDSAGIYYVSIDVNDGRGGMSVTSFKITVKNVIMKPHADFTFTPLNPKVNDPVFFDGSISYDPQGRDLTYTWDYENDGSIDDIRVNPYNTYFTKGCYDVKLTVSNGEASDSVIKEVCVSPIGDLIITEIDCINMLNVGDIQTCTIYLSKNIENAEIKLYDIDSDVKNGVCYTDSYGSCEVEFIVNLEGNFEVYATAYKQGYETDNDKAPTEEYEVTLKLLPLANPNGPYRYFEGQEIKFDSSGSRDPDGGEITYYWTFGDGSYSQEQFPRHVYANSGKYVVTLTVQDDEGDIASATTHAYIAVYEEPEYNLMNKDLIIKHTEIGQKNIVRKSDYDIPVMFTVLNNGEKDLERAELTFMIRELGLMKRFRNVDLDEGETLSKFISFDNPGEVGTFTLMVHIESPKVERTRFIEFEVI